jgi:transcription elongation factor Elf1
MAFQDCVFCGSMNVVLCECEEPAAGCSTFWIECEDCGARGPVSEYKDGAAIHWNAARGPEQEAHSMGETNG